MNNIYTEIGKKLEKYRKINKKTQSDIGKYLDVTFQQIQHYEKGRKRISIEKLQKLCELYKIALVEFLEESINNDPEVVVDLVNFIKKYPKATKEEARLLKIVIEKIIKNK